MILIDDWQKDSNASKYDFWTPCVKVIRVQSFIDISHVLRSEDRKHYYISEVLNGSHWWLTKDSNASVYDLFELHVLKL